ncbi:alpha/beta-hydrolase [Decorospora gaudefroyi]|uniref:Alpha/beta-hydrolase n=1 Tax=Decorospora gaudefroyi TaxID=184978 RepID=A0A6A5KCN6_9PLEO|nr:alpha/beta-hydrolase [Decorospora gaudefroyi]
MASAPHDDEAMTTYSMHVSAKYLELTKKKLELTRLPRELELPDEKRWEQGTPKSVLEPLLDFWLDGYDWRASEARFNATLPQYRTTITTRSSTPTQSLRIHLVHKRSKHTNAIPMLLCHTWPSSFIEVQRVIDALTDPQSVAGYASGEQQAFHVVAPSIPGFGFSDASTCHDFGLNGTAEVFDALMVRLGYGRYVAHGTGWGFGICRVLALQYPQHCIAVHTANPAFNEPTYNRGPIHYLKYSVAKLTQAKTPWLSFGYVPSEVQTPDTSKDTAAKTKMYGGEALGPTLPRLYSLRPQTLAFSLCDSPVGLLAALLDVIHTRNVPPRPLSQRSRSPFLSPVELGMQDEQEDGDDEIPVGSRAINSHNGDGRCYMWSPTEVLNFTMLQWLPGPEAALRWLRRAHMDTASPSYQRYTSVPLGISTFLAPNSSTATPLMWGASSWDISWVKRHNGRPATLPGFEAPDALVLDLRECFGGMVARGRIQLAVL